MHAFVVLQLADWRLERAGRISQKLADTVSSGGEKCTIEQSQREIDAQRKTSTSFDADEDDDDDAEDGMAGSINGVNSSDVRTAGLVIIGDEILNGFTTDVNLQVTSKTLASIGIPLKRVAVVSDDVDEIAYEVLAMSQKYDVVFTSGGIGPTHDDVTLKAVAQALDQRMKVSAVMLDHLAAVQADNDEAERRERAPTPGKGTDASPTINEEDYVEDDVGNAEAPNGADSGAATTTGASSSKTYSQQSTETDSSAEQDYDAPRQKQPPQIGRVMPRVGRSDSSAELLETGMRRLALLPEHAELKFPPPPDDYHTRTNRAGEEIRTRTWPLLRCDNIFVMPGIPQYFEAKMQLVVKHFLTKSQHKVEMRKIVLDVEERNLVELLDNLVQRHTQVKFGSYPFIDHPEFKTIITIEGVSLRKVEDAAVDLVDALPSSAVLRVERVSDEKHPHK